MTDRTGDEQAFAELSAGHAVGALSPEDERAYRKALAAHPEWRAIAEDDLATAALLADAAPEITPPPALRDTLLARIAETDAAAVGAADAADPPASVPPRPRRWGRALFALAASIALIVAIGWGASTVLAPEPGPVTALAEVQAAPDAQRAEGDVAGGGGAEVHWSESLGKVVLVADGLPSIEEDRTFELWFVRGETPVPAGTFEADGGTATALLDGTMQPGDTIAVTVEADGGSETGLPTTAPILAVATS